jgi:hypothetical protein
VARFLVAVMLLSAVGCGFSPPIRGLHPGMPGRLVKGQLEVGGEIGGGGLSQPTPPTTGGPHVAYGLSDSLVIEGGANLNFFELDWATLYGGVRLSRSKPMPEELQLVGELEVGAGLGLGGHLSQRSNTDWAARQAYGLYVGLGAGVRWRWLGGYVRGRLDASANTSAPSSLWPTVMAGVEARAGDHVVFGAGAGLGALWSEKQDVLGFWFYQAQVALLFDLSAPRAAR